MIKRIIEPLSETVLHIHYGANGLKSFKKYLDDNDVEYTDLNGSAGFQIDNHIFTHDITCLHTLIHEAVHFMDYIVERLNIDAEREFKAYIGSYIINKLIRLSISEKIKENA